MKLCKCGKPFVVINGKRWCSGTVERYRALYGEPKYLWNRT